MNKFQLFCLIYACFGATFYGYDTGITASVLAYENFIQYFELNSVTIGAFNSAYQAASAVGALLNFYYPNKLGRLWTIRLACAISLAGVTLQTASQNYPMFVVGRVMGGIACGIVFSVCPVYASELSPPHVRGRIGGLYALNIAVSFLFTQGIGLGLYFVPGNASWRVLFGLQYIPIAVLSIVSLWIPESPRWLCLKERHTEAIHALQRLHGVKPTIEHNHSCSYYREFLQIQAQIKEERPYTRTWRTVLTKKTYIKRFAMICSFFFFQQFTGIIPLAGYQVIIYQLLGTDQFHSLVLTIVWGVVTTAGAVCGGFWLDRLGRRNALLLCYIGMIPSMSIIVGFWAAFEVDGYRNLGLAKGLIVGMYLVCFTFSGVMNAFGPSFAAEIMPTEIRAAGLGTGYFVFNITGVLIAQITPMALDKISWRYFLIFLIMDCIYIMIVFFVYPETKGMVLERVGGVFGDVVAEVEESRDDEPQRHDNGTKNDL